MIDLEQLSFFAHHTEGELVQRFLSELATPEGAAGDVGACMLLPRWGPSTQLDRVGQLEPLAAFVIGDPDTRRMHLPFDARGRARRELAYLGESDPLANRDRFVRQSLRAQVANGRDVLVSPWLIHGLTADDDQCLRASVDFARRAAEHPLAEGRQLLMGFEASASVFADREQRDRMIDEIVDGEIELPIYLRMTIDAPESRRPYGEREELLGLRAACEALRENGLAVLLPQSGPVGWLMAPFGVKSFGAGTTSSMERNLRPAAGGTGGGGTPPLHWYFSASLLGPVLAEELPALSQQAGLSACTCPYCVSSPPAPGAAFDRNAAALHYLWWCAQLARELRGASDPLAAVRSRVESARALWSELRAAGVHLDSRSSENHLAAWSAAVA